MKEITYPVWNVTAIWLKDGKRDRVDFQTSQKEGVFSAETWWEGYIKKTIKIGHEVVLKTLTLDYLGEYTWFLNWFSHQSFNYFSNEESAFKSFEKYLSQFTVVRGIYDMLPKFHDKDGKEVCLMGAEDRFRWEYCGCELCRTEQITLIKH